MHMSFWWGSELGALLFDGLMIQTAGAMVAACLSFTILALIFEGMKVMEAKMRRDHKCKSWAAAMATRSDDTSNLLSNTRRAAGTSSGGQTFHDSPENLTTKCGRITRQVLLYTTNTSANYLIMLVIMLYSGYLTLATILGSMLGYFLFGHVSIRYNMEAVQERGLVRTVCAPECEEICDGTTPPLIQGRGASENTLYTCETPSKTSGHCHKSSPEMDPVLPTTEASVEICHPDRQTSCKKTDDPAKIKSSDTSCCKSDAMAENIDTCERLDKVTDDDDDGDKSVDGCLGVDTKISSDLEDSPKEDIVKKM